MTEVLVCSPNPIFIKNLYGILVDAGLGIEIADHHSQAISMVMQKTYSGIIVDAVQLGLSVEEATRILQSIVPEIPIIVVGSDSVPAGAFSVDTPVDLEEFRQLIDHLHCSHKFSQT